jgi:formate dehydrogenase subunit gamma
MSSVMQRQHVDRAIMLGRNSEDVIVGDEIIRHRRSARWIHWSVAVTFFVALFTGLPIWTPIFRWMAGFFGGLEVCRWLHPYAGSLFVLLAIVEFFMWFTDMRLQADEKGSWRPSKLMAYMRWEDEPATEGGKYNPGQKMFFYAVSLGAIGLLVSGIVMWFPLEFPPIVRELAILLHDITFICFIVGVIFHIYLGSAAEPGTFRSMTRGTVTRAWARLHHPGWFRQVTSGRVANDRDVRTPPPDARPR